MKRSRDVQIDEKIEFSSLIQHPHILQGLKNAGYQQPSPVQLKAIPLGRLGLDLIAQAKSGTGKTVVFSVIALEAVQTSVKAPQVLVLAPTREIAVQIRDVLRQIGSAMSTSSSTTTNAFRCEAVIGGVANPSMADVQVIVGTPGRVMRLMNDKKLPTSRIKLLVLDEADKLMSDNFPEQVDYIVSNLPPMRQSVAFSATFTDDLLIQLKKYVPKSPHIIQLTEGVPTLQEVQQYYVELPFENEVGPTDESSDRRRSAADTLMMYKKKFEQIEHLLGKISFYQCMIFVNTVPRAMDLENWLNDMGWKTGFIHAGLTQEKRLAVMERMRDFKLRILVCSDLIARGIDIDRVNLVINVEFPRDIDTYLHRVGRTGRYGTSGIAISLVCGSNDVDFLEKLKKEQITITPLPDKVSYTEYKKLLSENEQASLLKHESQKIESKPIKWKRHPNKIQHEGDTSVDLTNKSKQGSGVDRKKKKLSSDQPYSFDRQTDNNEPIHGYNSPRGLTHPFYARPPHSSLPSQPQPQPQPQPQQQQQASSSLSWKPFIPPDLFF